LTNKVLSFIIIIVKNIQQKKGNNKMKMYINIRVKDGNAEKVTLTVLGYEKAWDPYRQLAETLVGLAEVDLIDAENCEVIQSTEDEE